MAQIQKNRQRYMKNLYDSVKEKLTKKEDRENEVMNFRHFSQLIALIRHEGYGYGKE